MARNYEQLTEKYRLASHGGLPTGSPTGRGQKEQVLREKGKRKREDWKRSPHR